MTEGEVIAKSERTSARCAQYLFQAAERPVRTQNGLGRPELYIVWDVFAVGAPLGAAAHSCQRSIE